MVPTTVARVHPCATRPRRSDSGASNRNYSPSWILGPRTASKAGTSTTNDKPHHSSAARRLYATPNPLIESSDSSDATNTTNTSAAAPKTRHVVFAVDGTPASEQGLAWLARNILLKSTVGIIELDGRARSLVSRSPRSPPLRSGALTTHSHDALSRRTLARSLHRTSSTSQTSSATRARRRRASEAFRATERTHNGRPPGTYLTRPCPSL